MNDIFLIRVFILFVTLSCVFFVLKESLEEEANAMSITKEAIIKDTAESFATEEHADREDYGCSR